MSERGAFWRAWDRFAAWWEWDAAIISALVAAGVLCVGVTVWFFATHHCARYVTYPCTKTDCTMWIPGGKNTSGSCAAWKSYETQCRDCQEWVHDD